MRVTYEFDSGDETQRCKFESGETFFIALQEINEIREGLLENGLVDPEELNEKLLEVLRESGYFQY